MAKINSVSVWHEVYKGDARTIAEVFYSTGNCKRFYNSYSQSWPKTVSDFVESHDGRKVNSQVTEYADD